MEYLELEGIGPTGLIGRLTAGIQGYVALGVLSSQPSLHASTSSRLFRAAAPLFQKPFSPDELVLALAPLVRQSQEMRRLTRQMRADAAESRSLRGISAMADQQHAQVHGFCLHYASGATSASLSTFRYADRNSFPRRFTQT